MQESLTHGASSSESTEAENRGCVHVVGAGVMGGDIAAWCALRGYSVTLQDREMEYIQPALDRAAKLFEKRFRDPAELAATRDRLRADVAGDGVSDADIVIEAIFEDRDVKQALYQQLEPRMKADAVLATNTSSIPLELLNVALKNPKRLVGRQGPHFGVPRDPAPAPRSHCRIIHEQIHPGARPIGLVVGSQELEDIVEGHHDGAEIL